MPDERIDFETSLKMLEETVRALESGELSLERSIELYEKGIKLSHECAKALKAAKQKIVSLTEIEAEETEDA